MSNPAIGGEVAVSATPAVEFDPAPFQRFVRHELADREGEFLIERIAGGQSNPTYFVTLGARRMVLRKKPAGDDPAFRPCG